MTGTLAPHRRRLVERGLMELQFRDVTADPVRFCNELLFIPSQRAKQGVERFVLFDYQVETLRDFQAERFVVVLKSRQLGMSTLAVAFAVWMCMVRPGANVVLLSKSQEDANKAVAIAKVMWQFLPPWFKAMGPTLVTDTMRHMKWEHRDGTVSQIKAKAATETAAAGETVSLLIMDEMALYADPEQTYRTAMPTTDAGGQAIAISTARGGHNRFARLFKDARARRIGWKAIFHSWRRSELITPAEYEAKKVEFAAEPWLFYAEYPENPEEAFRESGRPRFDWAPTEDETLPMPWRGRLRSDSSKVSWQRDGKALRAVDDGELALTHAGMTPERHRRYVIAVDPATGTGGDHTVATVMAYDDDGDPTIYGVWRSNMVEPVHAAAAVADLGVHFTGADGPALVVVERTGGWGDTIIHELNATHEYRNLYVHRKNTTQRRGGRGANFGFPMHHTRRPAVIDRMATFLTDPDKHPDLPRLQGIYPELREELTQFVRREDGKVAADVGCHDDCVMSAAICLWVLTNEVGAGDVNLPMVDATRISPEQAAIVNTLTSLMDRVETSIVRRERTNDREMRRMNRRHARSR